MGTDRAHVNKGYLSGFFSLVSRIDDVTCRLHLENEHALPRQHHGASTVLAIDQYRVVGSHAANDFLPLNHAMFAVFGFGTNT